MEASLRLRLLSVLPRMDTLMPRPGRLHEARRLRFGPVMTDLGKYLPVATVHIFMRADMRLSLAAQRLPDVFAWQSETTDKSWKARRQVAAD